MKMGIPNARDPLYQFAALPITRSRLGSSARYRIVCSFSNIPTKSDETFFQAYRPIDSFLDQSLAGGGP